MMEEEEIPKPKSVVAPPGAPKKEHVNDVFTGHADADKSTTGGQETYVTGMIDKRTLEKYEREAKEKKRNLVLVLGLRHKPGRTRHGENSRRKESLKLDLKDRQENINAGSDSGCQTLNC
ncbi:hypothetical protein U0070_010733 [Myodes glareolus]|uniref:Uncharacterized protein n=1 Tax=Myodes glareolus TaxID=447135 RepID=A0AAW0HDQ6_MYOGA